MSKVRIITVIIITLAILCSLFIVAFADTSIAVGETVVTSTINPYEYGTSPDGLNDTPIDPESFLDGE